MTDPTRRPQPRPMPLVGRDEAGIRRLVEHWVGLLVDQRYDEALSVVASAEHWTPELLATVIRNYGFVEPTAGGATFKVTPIDAAIGDGPRFEVCWYEHPARPDVGYLHYDLPLNGEWSDVTASFDIVETAEGLVLSLTDVHVE